MHSVVIFQKATPKHQVPDETFSQQVHRVLIPDYLLPRVILKNYKYLIGFMGENLTAKEVLRPVLRVPIGHSV